jgi:hypothetical protein
MSDLATALLPEATPSYIPATLCYTSATLCYTPATPPLASETVLSLSCPKTYDAPLGSPCYTFAVISTSSDSASALTPAASSTYLPSPQSTPPATCSSDPLFRLTPIQERALDLLAAGRSVASAARELGVHRVTLQRWKTHHPRFMAELAHRASLSQVDATLNARRALNLATAILLKRIHTHPNASHELARHLVASPRLAHLAAGANPRTSLRQTLAELQQLRTAQPAAETPPQFDPALLNDLVTEISSSTDPEAAPHTSSQKLLASRPMRPELLNVLRVHRLPQRLREIVVRRPDLQPFDVIYYAFLHPNCDPERFGELLINEPPVGIKRPLDPQILCSIIKIKELSRLDGRNLADYQAAAQGPDLILTHRQTQEKVTLPANSLWRDALFN